jgi:gliding motility-associated-like protein
MRYWFCLFFSLSVTIGYTQDDSRKPKIHGQKPIATDEDFSVAIQLTDLEVRDRDSWFYPWGFTLQVYNGDNYTLNNNTVIPAANFFGTLSVPVTVNDGQNQSNKFDVQIQVRPINDAPVITGQASFTTNEDQAITIQQTHLLINDPDDISFTIYIQEGLNYTFSGQTITPGTNFNGVLSIPVRVTDGKVPSNLYYIQLPVIAINDAPKITGQLAIETDENKPVTIQLTQLTVTDVDNTYPNGFSMTLLPSSNGNYSVSGSQINPALNFEGALSVPVTVSDGAASSEPFPLQINVKPGNNAPVITGQVPITVTEDQSLTVQFSHITVTDADNNYPTGFTLRILPGTNYTATNNVVTPSVDFYGTLSVNIVVNDGTSDSNIYGLSVSVTPINDAPKIVNLEPDPLTYQSGQGQVFITAKLDISDVENDSITQADIAFKPETYRLGIDELIFQNTLKIKGTFDRQRAILSLSGKAPLAEYAQAIRSVKYNFLSGVDLPFETKTIVFTVSDGKTKSEKAERSIGGKNLIINLDIPTAFTPNGDAANDTWSIRPLKQSEEITNAVIKIYNKKGVLLYEAEGFDHPWDGRLSGEVLPADTYYYTIDLNMAFTRTLYKGLVTILR